MLRTFLPLTLALQLVGCATTYGSSGFAGGYFEKRLNDHLVKVSFAGNGYISEDAVQMYALYRCAEVTKEAGKEYFLLYDSLFAAALNRPSKQPKVGAMGAKPLAEAFVSFLDAPRAGAFEASAVLAELKEKVTPPTANATTGAPK